MFGIIFEFESGDRRLHEKTPYLRRRRDSVHFKAFNTKIRRNTS
jgi:hypothetical protein